jgi:hypothetical protein
MNFNHILMTQSGKYFFVCQLPKVLCAGSCSWRTAKNRGVQVLQIVNGTIILSGILLAKNKTFTFEQKIFRLV